MNTRSLLACLLVLALVSSFAQGLTIKTKHQRQVQNKHMATQFANKVQNHMLGLLHLADSTPAANTAAADTAADDNIIFQLLGLAFGDAEVFDSIMNNKPLSEEAAGRIKTLFKNSKSFKDQILTIFKDKDAPECMKNLSDSQQSKIFEIIIDNMDFQTVMNEKASDKSVQDDASMKKILEAVQADPELGDDVVKCYKENADAIEKTV